jgi:3',5'-cyclic AMP phosphodiesterase CpdA
LEDIVSTSAIAARYAELKEQGIDLGTAVGAEQDAGYGGRIQEYERGRIYWHASTGAHALSGRLLQRYLDAGGHDVNPATGERELGFPSSDHERTEDGLYECVRFEWGMISDVGGTPLVRLFGQLHEAWRTENGPLGRLGHPLTDVVRMEDGRASWFERGFLWHAEGSSDVLLGELVPPLLGQPALVDPQRPGPFQWLRLDGAVSVLEAKPSLPSTLMANRLSLVPVGGGSDPGAEPVVLDEAVEPSGGEPGRAGLGGPPAGVSGDMGSGEGAPARLPPIVHLEPDSALGERDGARWLSFHLPGGAQAGGGGGDGGRFGRMLEVRGSSDVQRPAARTLERRQLYSLAFRTAGMPLRTISPHCLYARSDWADFGIAHVTDIHVNRRAERYRATLRAVGVPEAVAKFNNWNDAFRDFIHYANQLHAKGRLDVVVLTGDLVDYVREADDHPDGPGNFAFFEALVQGLAPSPDAEGSGSEPLRVPVFTSLGNHDYRTHPYPLIFKVHVQEEDLLGDIPFVGDALEEAINTFRAGLKMLPGFGLASDVSVFGLLSGFADAITQFEGLNITRGEALRLVGPPLGDGLYGIPLLRPKPAGLSLEVDADMRERRHYYFRRINRDPSYPVALGPHRLVMLDTRWDAGLTDNVSTAVAAKKLGIGPESLRHLVGGNPDSEGVGKEDLDLVKAALAEARDEGIVLVGMHAPPINPADNEYPNYFRETAHPTADPVQITGYLHRVEPERVVLETHTDEVPDLPRPDAFETSPGWPRTDTPYFHRGEIEDLLDFGTGVGYQEKFARLVGDAKRGGATLVLCGHVHRRIDYRLAWASESRFLDAYTDYYLENPAAYYPMKLAQPHWWEKKYKRVLVRVEEGKPPEGELTQVRDNREGAVWETLDTLAVPPYRRPLAAASDPAAWWSKHGPMVVQTAALGPCTNTREDAETNADPPGPQFQGFRLLDVKANVIVRAHYLTLTDARSGVLPDSNAEDRAGVEPAAPPAGGGIVSG